MTYLGEFHKTCHKPKQETQNQQKKQEKGYNIKCVFVRLTHWNSVQQLFTVVLECGALNTKGSGLNR